MIDILKALSVDVHCEQCGDFNVGADVIAESQRLLAAGCPGSFHECPPQWLATLLPQSELESLRRAWDGLENATRGPAWRISLDDSQRIAPPANGDVDPRTLARWEDDGGYVPPGRGVRDVASGGRRLS